jgi:hypothetical protein
MATKKSSATKLPAKRSHTVTFDDALWSEVDAWIGALSPKPSTNKGIEALVRRGLSAITLAPELLQSLDKHRKTLPYEATRQQVTEALLWAGLGRDEQQAPLELGRSGPGKR